MTSGDGREHRKAAWMIAGSLCALVAACASPIDQAPKEGDPSPLPDGVGAATPRSPVEPSAADAGACNGVVTGCACAPEGDRIPCGTYHQVIGDYIRCGPAFITCTSGVWSECAGDRIVSGR